MKRILVTGGAGFLGSHLCDRLILEGHAVICADNLITGFKNNIEFLLSHPHFTFLKQDVVEPFEIEVDAIYNLACPASPIHYQSDPIQTMRTSVLGAMNLLELARKLRCPILQASTSEVYGDPEVHPQKETYWGHVNPIGKRSCYDEGKRAAETLFFDYHRSHQVPIKVVRIFNTYGPRMHPEDGRVISNFIVQALKGEPLTIYGDGTQTRSFCFVDDLIEGFCLMMQSKEVGPINLGNTEEYPMQLLAEEIIRLTGSSSSIVYHSLPSDDPKRRKPDLTLAKEHLGFNPKTPLQEGLKATIAYFLEQELSHFLTRAP